MHSELTTALFNLGASELRKTGKRKKNKVQPNTKRKYANVSHQAVSKGSAEKRKQSKILILNVQRKWTHIDREVFNTVKCTQVD